MITQVDEDLHLIKVIGRCTWPEGSPCPRHPTTTTHPIHEQTKVINQSLPNGPFYPSLFIKLTSIYTMWCGKSDSIMTISKLSVKLRVTWVLL